MESIVLSTQLSILSRLKLAAAQIACAPEFVSMSVMQAVVMENRCRDVSTWEGPVGGNLGHALYFDFADDNNFDEKIDKLVELIRKHITKLQSSSDNCAITETTIIPAKRKQNGDLNGCNISSLSLPKIVNYSERSVAVFGNSKALRDRFKALGGKFNSSLKWDGASRAGWIFCKGQLEEVRLVIESSKREESTQNNTCNTKALVSIEPTERVEAIG